MSCSDRRTLSGGREAWRTVTFIVAATLTVSGALSTFGCGDICGHDDCRYSSSEWNVISALSPLPAPPRDPTNQYDGNPDAITLGHQLFFEKRYAHALKIPSTLGNVGEAEKVSCVACHDPDSGFSDTRSTPNNVSLGVGWTVRNALPLVDTVYYQNHSWDLRHDTLWNQASAVIENGAVTAGDRCEYAHMLWTLYRARYDDLFTTTPLPDTLDPASQTPLPAACKPKSSATAPDGPWEMMSAADRDTVNRILSNQAKAVAAYESQLVSGSSPFDRYVAGDNGAISDAAKEGLRIFIGKAACVDCHIGAFFSDQKAHNVGVPQLGPNVPVVDRGLEDGTPQLLKSAFNSAGAYSDDPDLGMARLAGRMASDADGGKFRTQTLRNVTQTAPYMHNGWLATLRDVVDYYDRGGDSSGFTGDKDVKIRPLGLTETEKDQLVAFLETLTGDPIDEALRATPVLPDDPAPAQQQP